MTDGAYTNSVLSEATGGGAVMRFDGQGCQGGSCK
jgi:hypothetical protein